MTRRQIDRSEPLRQACSSIDDVQQSWCCRVALRMSSIPITPAGTVFVFNDQVRMCGCQCSLSPHPPAASALRTLQRLRGRPVLVMISAFGGAWYVVVSVVVDVVGKNGVVA